MLSLALSTFLSAHKVSYSMYSHPPAYSAQQIAEEARISGRRVAKTVVVRLDDKLALCVLPATESVNFSILRQVAGVCKAELANEDDFTASFPHCEPGVMPAFGNLYGLPVFLSEALKSDLPLAFSGENASERVLLSWHDYNELVHPIILTNQQRDALG